MVNEDKKHLEIPNYVNIDHQLDAKTGTLRVDVGENVLADAII